MIIIGIGKNYVNSQEELPNPRPEPVIFTKPETSLLINNQPFEIPAISNQIAYEVELAFRVCKAGKNIKKEEAHGFVDAIAVAIDFTAKDVLNKSRENKGPWALAKGFDGATPISGFKKLDEMTDMANINFALDINGERVQTGNSSLMINPLAEFIEYVSKYMTLNPGDILLTGTPAHGVGNVQSGDKLVASLEGEVLLDFEIR